jgi:hypothetical protein
MHGTALHSGLSQDRLLWTEDVWPTHGGDGNCGVKLSIARTKRPLPTR